MIERRLTHLEAARRQQGLSQQDLGEQVRIHQTFISIIERGEGLPTPDQAARLGAVLRVKPELLALPVEFVEVKT